MVPSIRQRSPVVPKIRTCPICHASFTATHQTHSFCSHSCASRALVKEKQPRLCPVCLHDYLPRYASQRHCSYACAAKSLEDRKDVICAHCGRAFHCSSSAKRTYCSKQCHDRSMVKQVACVCPVCDAPFLRSPAALSKGQRHYCSLACARTGRRGPGSPNWKGGRQRDANGYVVVVMPNGYRMLEHRLVMQQMLDRPLRPGEHVHHRNRNKRDNRPENLELIQQREHSLLHFGTAGRWARQYDACIDCGETSRKHACRGRCYRCYQAARRPD